MSRILFSYILPLLLPAILYVVWVSASRRFGSDPDKQLRDGPWFWIIIAGIALMAVGLVTWGVEDGAPPTDGTYRAPRYENGEIIPGHVVPPGTPPPSPVAPKGQ